MAETTVVAAAAPAATSTPAAGGGNPPPAAPASAGKPSPGAGSDAGRQAGLDDAFGETVVPLTTGDGQPPKTDTPPPAGGDAGKAAADGEPAPGADNKETAEPVALPFDDELQGLVPVDGAAPQAEVLPDLSTPEAITKAVNPDGKASVEQQLTNAQQLLGKHSGEVSKARQIANTFEPFLTKGEDGAFTGFNLVAMADKMGQEFVTQQLAAAGLKVVPVDAEIAGAAAGNEIGDAEIAALAKLPGVDAETRAALLNPHVSVEDKLALIKGNEDLRLEAKLLQRDRQRQQQFTAKEAVAQANRALEGRLTELATADKGFKALTPAMQAWNAKLPKELSGALRGDVLYRLAKLERLLSPEVRQAQAKAIYAQAEQDFLKKHQLTAGAAGGGGVLPGGGQRADDKAVWGD